MVGVVGFEPTPFGVKNQHSRPLNYTPKITDATTYAIQTYQMSYVDGNLRT